MKKKIFILTGEASGDKLASTVISKLNQYNDKIDYLSVGGSNLSKLGIKSIFDINDITYIGFTSVILNLFKIKKKIDYTVNEILKFDPDIIFSVDSPEFTLRVSEKIKKIKSNIKIIHYVAPQVWIWRENRVKKFKKFVDHFLLLFEFEKKFFDKESIKNTFVGHPLLEKNKSKIDISGISKGRKIISLFPGSRLSELKTLFPILVDFVKLMNKKFNEYIFVFHTTDEFKNFITTKLNNFHFENTEVVSDKDIKSEILLNSIFAVAKSGTVSLEICNAKVPSIIIYKINFINFMIMKFLVKVNFANIINIINNKEIIPELLQDECNAKEIYNSVTYMLKNPELAKKQLDNCNQTLEGIRSKSSSSNEVALILRESLIG